MNINYNKQHIIKFTLYSLLVILSVYVCYRKQNISVDEVSTFELSNYPAEEYNLKEDHLYHPAQGQSFKDKVRYQPPQLPWMDLMSVHLGHQFDYKNVWDNQSLDVHPPFYYCLIHTICSLFPGEFNMWYGLIVNIFFILMSLWVMFLLLNELTNDQWIKNIIALFFVISPAILNSIALIRMYTIAMFFILILSYLFVKLYNTQNWNWKTLVPIAICTILGALTHYYIILYVVATTIVFLFVLLSEKKYKKMLAISSIMIFCAIIAIVIFPSMIDHTLGSGVHGQNARAAILNFASIKQRMHRFFSMDDALLFGFMLPIVILAYISFVVWLIVRKIRRGIPIGIDANTIKKWIIIIIPTFVFFVIVAQTATYIADRYHYPIYPLIIVIVLCNVWWILKFIPQEWIRKVTMIILLTGITIAAYHYAYWGNLGIIPKDQLNQFEQHKDADCIFIYKGAWNIYPAFYQIQSLNSVIFYQYNDIEDAKNYAASLKTPFILYIDELCNLEEAKRRIGDNYSFTQICKYGLGISYLVDTKKI